MVSYKNTRLPTLYIPHGGGPCFFMKEAFGPPGTWDKMEEHLRGLSAHIGQIPKAILVISAHWEEDQPTILTGANPALLYDYYGFPEHTYHLKYPAPGSPDVAARIGELLINAGITTGTNPDRGFDHGVFIPFMLIYPEAQIPIVQLSLRHDLDPAIHIDLGKALEPLRDEGVLIVGSGMSYHNLKGFFSQSTPKHTQDAFDFDEWLNHTITEQSPDDRNQQLISWKSAPGALTSHPREEHLLPLMVTAGAAHENMGIKIYTDTVMGKPISSFLFP